MRIDSKQPIAGHPSMLVRKLLQRGHGQDWGRGLVEDVLGVTPEEAGRVLVDLAELQFIKPAGEHRGGTSWWSNTVKGNALANATAAKPIRRDTADRSLKEFLSRVEEVNRDPSYVYGVRYVVVFGSYLSDTPTVNDVDIAIELQPKESDPDMRDRLHDERISLAIRSGRQFSNILQEVSWPRTEVWLKLKSRSRTLSLHDLEGEAKIIRNGPHQVVFTDDSEHPVPEVLQ